MLRQVTSKLRRVWIGSLKADSEHGFISQPSERLLQLLEAIVRGENIVDGVVQDTFQEPEKEDCWLWEH